MVLNIALVPIESIGPSKVKTVSGEFGLSNKSVFDDLYNSGLSAVDSAWGTPLGKTMKELGFAKVEVGTGYNPSFKFSN